MKPPQAIHDVMQAYFNDKATPGQIQTLEAWLREDASHVRLFVDLGLLDGLMLSVQKDEDAAAILAMLAEAEENAEPDFSLLHKPTFDSSPRQSDKHAMTVRKGLSLAGYALRQGLRTQAGVIGSIAAVLVLGLVLYLAIFSGGRTSDPQGIADRVPTKPDTPKALVANTVATLTGTHNARWAPSAEGALAPGSPLKANQRHTLTAGFAKITTATGAVLLLEGPCTLDIHSNNQVSLTRGRLVATCPTPASKGFTVDTPGGQIIDLGTEFGVAVLEDSILATVFDGMVQVNRVGAEPVSLSKNQTARMVGDGRDGSRVVIDQSLAAGFVRELPSISSSDESAIASVNINHDQFRVQVVPGGVREDARLFTDRDHELNGLDATGLPPQLLDGDLVRTPGDARSLQPGSEPVQIELELAKPANVYVLFTASGGGAPPWLANDFERTPMRVGVDFGPSLAGHQIGVGAGVSVNAELAVWRRKQTSPGRITFGQPKFDAMYSIVVVPVQTSEPEVPQDPLRRN